MNPQQHPLDHPLMREAQRHRALADRIDELRRELAPRTDVPTADQADRDAVIHATPQEFYGQKPGAGTRKLALRVTDETADRLRAGEVVEIGGPDYIVSTS